MYHYWQLNQVNIKNKYHYLQLMTCSTDYRGLRYFPKLIFNSVITSSRFKKKKKWWHFLRRPSGLEKVIRVLIVPFKLTNAPAAFMGFMNHVFKPYPDQFVIVFVEDILICSWSLEAHEQHLNTNLQTLRAQKLYAKFNQCEFWLKSVAFLGHVISKYGTSGRGDNGSFRVGFVSGW